MTKGKPVPDVYIEAASRLGVSPRDCVVLEDSKNGERQYCEIVEVVRRKIYGSSADGNSVPV